MKRETKIQLLDYSLSSYKYFRPYTSFEQSIMEHVLAIDIMESLFVCVCIFVLACGLNILFDCPFWLSLISSIIFWLGLLFCVALYVNDKLLASKLRVQENARQIQDIIQSGSNIYITVKPNIKTWEKGCSKIAKIDIKADVWWWTFKKQNAGKWLVSGHLPVGVLNQKTGETNLQPQFLSSLPVPDDGANLCVVLQTLDKKRPYVCSEFEVVIDDDIIKLHSCWGSIDEEPPVVHEDVWINADVVLEDIANRIYTAYKPYDDEVNKFEKYALQKNNPKHQTYVQAWKKRENFIVSQEFQKVKFGPVSHTDIMQLNGLKYVGHKYLDVYDYIYGAVHTLENKYFIIEIHQVDNKLYERLTKSH